jgi:hypothetical protein
LRRRRSGSNADVLSTKVTLAYNEYFIADGVINTSNDDVNTGDQFYVDVDEISTIAPKGLSVIVMASTP